MSLDTSSDAHIPAFNASSQFRHWRFTPAQLTDSRHNHNHAAVKVIADNFDREQVTPTPAPPRRLLIVSVSSPARPPPHFSLMPPTNSCSSASTSPKSHSYAPPSSFQKKSKQRP
jgi:hypothetical protein